MHGTGIHRLAVIDAVPGLWDPSLNVRIRDALDPVVPFFELVTHLGDGALLIALAVAFYWFAGEEARHRAAFVIGVGVLTLVITYGLKGVFGIPRPTIVYELGEYPGYAFPSGHASASAAFYGALAVALEIGRRRWRLLVAAAIAATVALSRVVIGVHYVGDVLVGAGIGVAAIWLGISLARGGRFRPRPLFGLAAVIAIIMVLLGSTVYTGLSLGTATGGFVGWYLASTRAGTDDRLAIVLVALVGLPVLGALVLLSTIIPHALLALGVEALGYALLTTYTFLVPVFAYRLEGHAAVSELRRALPANRFIEDR